MKYENNKYFVNNLILIFRYCFRYMSTIYWAENVPPNSGLNTAITDESAAGGQLT